MSPPATMSDAPRARSFAARRSSIRDARTWVRGVAAPWLDAARLPDVELAASELVTNAIEYGGSGAIEVVVRTTDQRLELEVHSPAGATKVTSPATWATVVPPSYRTGRGLHIVSVVSDGTWVTDGTTTVAVGCWFSR